MTLLLTALVVFTKMFAKINLFLSAIVGSPKMFAKWNLLLAALVVFTKMYLLVTTLVVFKEIVSENECFAGNSSCFACYNRQSQPASCCDWHLRAVFSNSSYFSYFSQNVRVICTYNGNEKER